MVAALALLTPLASTSAVADAGPAPTQVTTCAAKILDADFAKKYKATCEQIVVKQCANSYPKRDAFACDVWVFKTTPGKACADVPSLLAAPCTATNDVANTTGDVANAVADPKGAASSLASAGFDAVAGKFGSAATTILSQMTSVFLTVSTIDLRTAGISSTYSLTWALSATVALLLLLWQFAKLAVTGRGEAGATAITGVVKWSLISAATLAVTQTALAATNEISNAIITSYYKNGQKDFQRRIDSAFGKFFTTPQENTAIVFMFGLLAVLVVLVLWGEMLIRQAALQVILVVMPIVAAGSMNDATRDWWPKARNAVISLILIKPVIVLIFVIGFREAGQSSDIQSFLVGLLTIFLGALAWPALAKFMTFTSAGSGGGLASGLLGAAGGSAGSMFGYGGGMPSGAGSVGGGAPFTKAVESENDGAAVSAGRAAGGSGASGASGAAAGAASGGLLVAAAMAAQVAKASKEIAEGGMNAMAGHADLGSGGSNMGGQVQLPRSRSGSGGQSPAPAPQRRPDTPPPNPPPSTPPPPAAPGPGDGEGTAP